MEQTTLKKNQLSPKDILTIIGFIAAIMVFYGNMMTKFKEIDLRMEQFEKNNIKVELKFEKIDGKLDGIQESVTDIKISNSLERNRSNNK